MTVAGKIKSLVATTLCVGVLATAVVMWSGVIQESEYNSLLTHEVAQVESSRQLQVTFKKQVQAWKDILLRGSDPASLEKYSTEFFSLDQKVADGASHLQAEIQNPEVSGKVREFADAHQRLGENYRAALEKFRASSGKDFAAADSSLKGQDRAPTDLLDGVVKSLQESSAAREAAIVASARAGRRNIILGLILTVVIAGILAARLSRKIAQPIHNALQIAQTIAAGDLTGHEIPITSHDEIGELSQALNQMQSTLHEMIRSIRGTAEQVAAASGQLSATSQQITSSSSETSAQAAVVSQSSQHVNQNLHSVSTGAAEMSSTIQSIASNAHQAATVASKAVQTMQAANATVGKLGDSSAEIGAVIKVITSIAQQTNLLALNATIEAARAGEVGKGFAVVANEVKELAKQTALATEDISRKISAIQLDTRGAVDAIATISGVIDQINGISATIATAVEEQSATTNEMTRNVADAATSSGEITRNIDGLAEAARGTSASAQDSQNAARQLTEMANHLRDLVVRFKVDAESPQPRSGPNPRAAAHAAGIH